jgi:glucan phosphoethanolaminetransferase (alkaline phosphatase superfamily)
MPEFIRKFFVALKRKPQNIPLVAVTISFIWYSFNLSTISFTTSRLQGNNMGLTGFAIMLFSTLAIMCCMNAFPYRKPVHKPMLIILFVMLGIIVFCDIHYLGCIAEKMDAGIIKDPIVMDRSTQARGIMTTHVVMIGISALLIATLPVYRKLIRKINTSVDLAEGTEMAEIDISGE